MKIVNCSCRSFSLLLLSMLIASLVGCGDGTNPVSGTITFNGAPMVGGGNIEFVPTDGERNPAAGVIDENGKYVLGTFDTDDGALLGEYRVQITQNEVLESATYTEIEPPAEGEQEKEGVDDREQKEKLIAKKDRIPTAYIGPKSTLTATVTSGKNSIDFDLKGS